MKQRNSWVVASTVLACWLAVLAVSAGAQAQTASSGVITKSVTAVGYQVGGGSTKVDMKSTELVPQASGTAKVEIKKDAGRTSVDVELQGLTPPSTLGAEFLTYVLWVVTPEGRAGNTGEILIDKNGQGKLTATTPAQTFSLIVTAEPYFAVRAPSEMVVLQSETRKDTKGKRFPVSQYTLLKRGQYEKLGNPLAMTPDLKTTPLEMYEARNAVEIAKSRGADKYAPEIFSKAEGSLKIAENSLASKADKKAIISAARQTVQFSEDARALTVQRAEEERITNEREAAAAQAKAEAETKAAAEAAEAKQQSDAAAAEAKRKSDEEAQRQADLAAAKEKELKAREKAARDDAERTRKAAQEMRAQLLAQLNRILETQDTPRGLVVNMADVLFDIGKHDLRPETREKLAKLSGVILSHPGLNLAIEGYTDSTGSDDLNQKLSEQRAQGVQNYLVEQGLAADSVTSNGLGKAMPVADNATAEGRKKNRRVEIIVSGEVIGEKVGS